MYKNFYGFSDKPFSLTPDPEYLFLGNHHRQALHFLNESMGQDFNLIALSGVIGSGKTILLRSFLKNLDHEIKVIQVFYPTSSKVQLLQMVLQNIGIKSIHEDLKLLRSELMNHLNILFQSHKRILLIIDEAQNLAGEALDELYRIIEPQDNIKSAKALLVGLPDLLRNLSGLKIKTNITNTYHNIKRLPDEEVISYINSRLAKAGRSDETIFPKETINEISLASAGIPRVINIICESALTQGYLSGVKTITLPIIEKVLDSLNEIIGPRKNIHDSTTPAGRSENPTDNAGDNDYKRSNVQPEASYPGSPMIPHLLSLRILVLEKNARMRVHLEDHFQKIGYNSVITDSFENLIATLSIRSKWELQVIVLDAAFFLPDPGKDNTADWSNLDRIQTTYAYVPIIITAILPLSAVRETLLNRGIVYLLKKPDLGNIDLSGLKESIDAFVNGMQNILANLQSQYNSFFTGVIKWSIKQH